MRILRIDINHFRGFRKVTIRPAGHVVLGGEPRGGRSSVVESLRRIFSAEATRFPLTDDLDFFKLDCSKPIQIEAVVGELGEGLEQDFFDQLEPWDAEAGQVLPESSDPVALDEGDEPLVVRLRYQAHWNSDTEVGEHWVDFPKLSDDESNQIARVPRRLLEGLPFVLVDASGKPLGLGGRSDFRRLVDSEEGADFGAALEGLVAQIETAAAQFSEAEQVSAALNTVFDQVRHTFGLAKDAGASAVQFLPEGGSVAGVLRSLGPSVSLPSSPSLPLVRHGSTAVQMLRIAEALALRGNGDAVAVVDDFGENLDVTTATHLAARLRSTFSQVWLSSRRGSAAEVFRPEELIRLTRPRKDSERVHHGRSPVSRSDRVASRHLSLQLLPAIACKTLVVLEGPHDRAGLNAVSVRRFQREGIPLPAARSIFLADAGAADRSGGTAAAVKLAAYAADLGFRVVVVLDGDEAGDEAEAAASASAYAVVRLPQGAAIERALVEGVPVPALRQALEGLRDAFSITLAKDVPDIEDDDLAQVAIDALKSKGGLHAQFVEMLPGSAVPPVAAAVLDEIVRAGRGRASGVVQL